MSKHKIVMTTEECFEVVQILKNYIQDKNVDKDLEYWCWEEVNKYLDDKYLKKGFKRDLKSKILFVENKGLRQTTFKKCKVLTDGHLKYFKSKYPNRDALNFMPQDKAFKIYAQYMK